jgi:hypothetical protein
MTYEGVSGSEIILLRDLHPLLLRVYCRTPTLEHRKKKQAQQFVRTVRLQYDLQLRSWSEYQQHAYRWVQQLFKVCPVSSRRLCNSDAAATIAITTLIQSFGLHMN